MLSRGVAVGVELRERREAGAEDATRGEDGVGLEGGEGGDVDDRSSTLRLHDRSDEPRGADHVEEVDVHAGVPLLIGELEHGRARPVGGAVDESIDPAPARHRAVDESLEVVVRLVGTGDAEAAELGGQRLPLARGGQHGNVEAVCGKASRSAGTDAASAGRDDRNLTLAHDARNDRGGHGGRSSPTASAGSRDLDDSDHVGPNLSVLMRLGSWPSVTSASATASTNPVGPQM